MLKTSLILSAGLVALLFQTRLSADDSPTLLKELCKLDDLRNGKNTPFDKLETRGAELLKQYTEKREQGLIYYELAHIYSQCGVQHPDRIKKYVGLALDRLDDPLKRATMWCCLSSAIEVDGTIVPHFEVRRPKAAQACLDGLQELIALKLPATPPELPVVGRFAEGSIGPAELAKMKQISRDREEAVRIKELLHYREVFIRHLGYLYSRPPLVPDEARRLAEATFKNPDLVDEIMKSVNDAVDLTKKIAADRAKK